MGKLLSRYKVLTMRALCSNDLTRSLLMRRIRATLCTQLAGSRCVQTCVCVLPLIPPRQSRAAAASTVLPAHCQSSPPSTKQVQQQCVCPHLLVEAAQRQRLAVDQVRLGAQPRKDACRRGEERRGQAGSEWGLGVLTAQQPAPEEPQRWRAAAASGHSTACMAAHLQTRRQCSRRR